MSKRAGDISKKGVLYKSYLVIFNTTAAPVVKKKTFKKGVEGLCFDDFCIVVNYFCRLD